MGLPVCIALNMVDAAKKRGIEIDEKRLAEMLNVPVIPTIARSGRGKDELMQAAEEVAKSHKSHSPLAISYGQDIDQALFEMERLIRDEHFLTDAYLPRWIALKYLEADENMRQRGKYLNPDLSAELDGIADRVSDHLEETLATDPEAMIADHRYGYIRSIVNQGIITHGGDLSRLHMSDRIDAILTHRFFGPLIMIGVLFGLYQFTFTYSELPVNWLETVFTKLTQLATDLLPDGVLKSLVISAVINGVGGVLGFVPLIVFMFFGIAILEDSGYLARVAFMLDRIFRIFGLHGSAVMPFIISGGIAGGCAVPGVMAARTLKSPRERLTTILTVPFMNCGAKLPVFALLVATFFARYEAMMMFGITLGAWAGALLVARLLRSTVIRGEATPFVMELPPYRLPTLKGVATHTWERTWQYIKKAGTIILAISIIMWALMSYPGLPDSAKQEFKAERQALFASVTEPIIREIQPDSGPEELSSEARHLKAQLASISGKEAEAGLRHSIAGRIGQGLESISRMAGFDWRVNIALLGGIAAKEVVVSTLGTAYSLGEVDPEDSKPLADTLAQAPGWRPLTALSLILFIMFYAPCFVSVVCISRESGSWKWGAFSIVFNTLLAFTLAATVFQLGSLVGF
jgi:ferrous iron transport protein B